ncbi:MAG: carboxypeptidase regulatory-like domain-containing protein [Edaphobacter sp.]
MKKIMGLAIFFLICVCVVRAQTSTGTIQGHVLDPTAAFVSGAKITLTEQRTAQIRSQTSDSGGFFEFRALPIGVYKIQVEQSGFAVEVVTGVTLQVAETKSIQVGLHILGQSETVTVQSSAALLQIADPGLSTVIDQRRVTELPINGRNVLQLASLAPGITTSAKGSATERQGGYGPGFVVGGQRDNTNIVLVDGIEISGMELNNYPLAIPSLDDIEEFRVQTSNYSAEFGGNSGAVINIATRRGTNAIHGTLFEFFRNEDLDAKNYFSTHPSLLKRNQFGGIIAGPLVIPKLYDGRNKTFWLISYEGSRQRSATPSTAIVPTDEERSGNFIHTTTIIVDPFTKLPYSNNAIPASLINPVGQALLNLYPKANTTNPAANFSGAPSQSLTNDVYSGRLDQTISQKDTVFGRFTINQPFTISPGAGAAFSGYNQLQHDWNLQAVIGNTAIVTSHIVNETNIGFVRFTRRRGSQAANVTNYISTLDIQGPTPPPYAWAAPQVSPLGLNSVGYGSGNAVFNWSSQSIQIVDNLSVQHGHNTVKVGFTINKKLLGSTQFGSPNGAYTFSGQFSAQDPVHTTTSANAIADLLLGYPSAYTVQTGPYVQDFHYSNLGIYVQDVWTLSPNFTINAGVRWEFFGKPADTHNRIGTFDLVKGTQVNAGQGGVPSALVYQRYGDVSPRVGFGWRPFGNDKTSLRGGYGIFYTPEVINTFRNLGFQNPFGTTYSLSTRPVDPSKPIPGITVQSPLSNVNPSVSFATVLGINPNFKDGNVGSWNLNLEQMLAPNVLLEIAYTGTKSTHLSSELNYNQTNPYPAQPPNFVQHFPYPTFGTVNYFDSNGAGTYNALQVRLQKRYSKGLTILASYTWNKNLTNIDQSSVGTSNAPGNAYAPQVITPLGLNKGFAVGGRPQQATLSGLYDIPLLTNEHRVLDRIVGHWEVGVDSTFASGSWLTPSSYGVSYVGSRANLTGNPNLPRSQRTIQRWFDVSKLQNPAPGQLGNSSKGTIMGSGTNLTNLVLLKKFLISDERRLELRGEFFNVFNHTQFDDPYTYPGNNPQAGKITSASDFGYAQTERIIQIGLKCYF